MKHVLLVAFLVASGVPAQATWIVNAGGGPGVQFTTLAAAVAAASDGDTILVQQPPMGEAVEGFTTDKGLTILGAAAGVPITTTPQAPIAVVGLPAGRAFRMAGFVRVSDGALDVLVQNCAGTVHLENLKAREPDWVFPAGPGVRIEGSASVTLRGVVAFGLPAVQIDQSRVVLSGCRLGQTEIGLGGGPCLVVTAAEVDVVQPRFDTLGSVGGGGTPHDCIVADQSLVRIAGDGGALVSARSSFSGAGGHALVATGGTVLLSPAVPVLSGGSLPGWSGTATFVLAVVPATWTGAPTPGLPVGAVHAAAPGALLLPFFGPAAAIVATPFGPFGLDPAATPVWLPVVAVPAGGTIATLLGVPPPAARGYSFVAQALGFDGSSLWLTLPAVSMVH